MGYDVNMQNNIKKYRKQLGISCNDLGAMIGFSQKRLSHYELGDRNPGLNECRLIVWGLNTLGAGVTLNDVFPD